MFCFTPPPIYAIANIDFLEKPLAYIKDLVAAKVSIIQIRSKTTDDKTLLKFTQKVMKWVNELKIEQKTFPTIIVNDRPDICNLGYANGVHLGQDDMTPKEARKILGRSAIIGLSTHNLKQFQEVDYEHINYVAVGPIYSTQTKKNLDPLVGIGQLNSLISLARLPVVAIGGITPQNAKEVFETGVSSIAICKALQEAHNLKDCVRSFLYLKSTPAT